MFVFAIYEKEYAPRLIEIDRILDTNLLLVIDEFGKKHKATAITDPFHFIDENQENHFRNWYGVRTPRKVIGIYREEEIIW